MDVILRVNGSSSWVWMNMAIQLRLYSFRDLWSYPNFFLSKRHFISLDFKKDKYCSKAVSGVGMGVGVGMGQLGCKTMVVIRILEG